MWDAAEAHRRTERPKSTLFIFRGRRCEDGCIPYRKDQRLHGHVQLPSAGYVAVAESEGTFISHVVPGANGQLGSIEYTILEQPKTPSPTQEKPIRENPVQANPMLDAPIQENPAQLNKEESSNYPSKTDLSITQESSPMVNRHPDLFEKLIEWEHTDNLYHRRLTRTETPS